MTDHKLISHVCTDLKQFLAITQFSPDSVYVATWTWLYNTHGRGLFVGIHKGKLRWFLPIHNTQYINTWHNEITIEHNMLPSILLRDASREAGLPFTDQHNYHAQLKYWKRNGILVRGDKSPPKNVWGFEAILETALEIFGNPNITVNCFINTHDFPVAASLMHVPIFSMCTNIDYHDILIPTWDDYQHITTHPYLWTDRIPKAVWRGSTTGSGVTITTNMRIKLAHLGQQYPNELDACLTKWNTRPRIDTDNVLKILRKVLEIPLGQRLDIFIDQAKYKYAILIDGNVASFRLRTYLALGMVVLFVDSPYKIWYHDKLIAGIHYIPIAQDLSDLITTIQYCQQNDEEMALIALNARKFYEDNLTDVDVARTLFTTLMTHG